MPHKTTRRDFIKQTTALGSALFVGPQLLNAAPRSANEELNFACIGVGGKGSSDTDHAGQFGRIVGLCDIDGKRLDAKAAKFPSARKFFDFREMLDFFGDSVDAVTVSTPDHTHAVAAIHAMKMGKHVYCQKPLTHTVVEARLMREIAAKQGVATQMGNQGTAEDGLRQAVEVVQSGAIGPVREVHVWTNRPGRFWKQAPDIVERPKETPPVPDHVHWNLFLGPAPERPYHPIYHPFSWRGWWDFGTGALGDMACHTANMAFLALKLGYPKAVSAESGPVNPETYPGWATIRYEFPARGDLPPVVLTWYEGTRNGQRNLPSAELVEGRALPSSGLILVGEKGVLFSPNDYGAQYILLPEKSFKGYKPPKPWLPRIGGGDHNQKREWVEAIRGGRPAMANFDYAAVLTESMLLGNVAIRAGRRIEYDAEKQQVTNLPSAQAFLHMPYRKGWSL